MYLEGRGVAPNVVQAEIWFIIAAASGDPTAETLRNYVARDYMTDDQVGRAAREAWYWEPRK
jgi:TPR repeat protein